MFALFLRALRGWLHLVRVRCVHPRQPHQVPACNGQPNKIGRIHAQPHGVPLKATDVHPLPLAARHADEVAQGNGHSDKDAHSPRTAGAGGSDVITHADTQGYDALAHADTHRCLCSRAVRDGDGLWGLPGRVRVLRCVLLGHLRAGVRARRFHLRRARVSRDDVWGVRAGYTVAHRHKTTPHTVVLQS